MIKVLKEFERGIVFRQGQIIRVAGPGLAFFIPLIEMPVIVNLDEVIPEWKLASAEEVNKMVTFLALYYYPGIPTRLSLGKVREDMREKKFSG